MGTRCTDITMLRTHKDKIEESVRACVYVCVRERERERERKELYKEANVHASLGNLDRSGGRECCPIKRASSRDRSRLVPSI